MLLLRCTDDFETRELGFPQDVSAGTVWYRRRDVNVPGGYEDADLYEVVDGVITSHYVRVRHERLHESFSQLPLSECGVTLPPELCHQP